jgi:hypothetical protein
MAMNWDVGASSRKLECSSTRRANMRSSIHNGTERCRVLSSNI